MGYVTSQEGSFLGSVLEAGIYGCFQKIGVSQNGWFIMENPTKMDDLGVPLFSETSIWKSFPSKLFNIKLS